MLAAVEGEHGGSGVTPAKALVDRALADAGSARVGRHLAEEGAEIATAGRGLGGEREKQGQQQGGERAFKHGGCFILSGPGMTEGHALR